MVAQSNVSVNDSQKSDSEEGEKKIDFEENEEKSFSF